MTPFARAQLIRLTDIVQKLNALVVRQRHVFCDDDESQAKLQFEPLGRLGKQNLHDPTEQEQSGPAGGDAPADPRRSLHHSELKEGNAICRT